MKPHEPLSAASGLTTTELAHRHFSRPAHLRMCRWLRLPRHKCWSLGTDSCKRLSLVGRPSTAFTRIRIRKTLGHPPGQTLYKSEIEMLHPLTPAATTRKPGSRGIRCRDAADSSAVANRSTRRRGSWTLSRASMIRHLLNDRTLPHNLPFFSGRCGGSSPTPINRLSKSSLCHGQNINIECSRGPNRFLTQNLDAALERLHASRKILFRRQWGSHFQG